MEGDAMSTQQEREFVEGAARTAYVMAWAEREARTCQWRNPDTGHKCREEQDAPVHEEHHTFKNRSFAGKRPEDIAPPTPQYAREWAWKLLGALEAMNGRFAGLPGLLNALASYDGRSIHDGQSAEFAREFGSYAAHVALGMGVWWFDDCGQFKLHVPEWYARGFELED